MQLKRPLPLAVGRIEYACLPPADPSGRWYRQLPTWLHAWGWGLRERYTDGLFQRIPTRLHHTPVVTRALTGWSKDIHELTDYEQRGSEDGPDQVRMFYLISPTDNGTTHHGDSGSGVVLPRRNITLSGVAKAETGALVGDVLYGITSQGFLSYYSLNESTAEQRMVELVISIPYILGGR